MLDFQSLASLTFANALKHLLGVCTLYYVGWIIYTRFFHPLKDFPGPFLASVSNWWFWHSVRYGIAENTQLPLHKKYGPVVRITPSELSLANASALDIVYGPKQKWKKTDFFASFNPHIGDRVELFSALDNAKHSERRKITAPLFATGAVLQYEANINRIVAIFLNRLEDAAVSRKHIDMSWALRQYTLDAIGEIFYGKEGGFNSLKNNTDHKGWLAMLDAILAPLSSIGYVPKGAQTLYFMSQLLSSSNRTGLRAFATIISDAKAVVKERRDEDGGKKDQKNDMLSRLVAIVDEKGMSIDFDDDDVAVNVYDAIMAGSDTTGIALTHLFYLIVKDRRVYDKLVNEVRTATTAGSLASPVRYTEAVKLEYWCACVKEAERYSPSGGVGQPRIIPSGGVTLPGGQYLPGDFHVTINPNVVHFDQECFGDDAERFRPERWIENDEESIKNMERHLIGFGKGPRVCLGKHVSFCSGFVLRFHTDKEILQLAIVEIHKLIPALLQNFDFELEGDCILQNHWFRRRTNVKMKVTRRA